MRPVGVTSTTTVPRLLPLSSPVSSGPSKRPIRRTVSVITMTLPAMSSLLVFFFFFFFRRPPWVMLLPPRWRLVLLFFWLPLKVRSSPPLKAATSSVPRSSRSRSRRISSPKRPRSQVETCGARLEVVWGSRKFWRSACMWQASWYRSPISAVRARIQICSSSVGMAGLNEVGSGTWPERTASRESRPVLRLKSRFPVSISHRQMPNEKMSER